MVPKLIIQPDAPRFVAPGDAFEASLPLVNRSGGAGEACTPWRARRAAVTAVVNGEEKFFDPTAELNASSKTDTYTTERYY